MNRRTFALALAALAAAPGALAQSNGLDGRKFHGVFLEKGKTWGDADKLVFKNGRFRSLACDRYGYSDAPYRATAEGDSIRFEAETESPRYGKLVWKGVVRGDRLDATATMIRAGRPPKENWVLAAARA